MDASLLTMAGQTMADGWTDGLRLDGFSLRWPLVGIGVAAAFAILWYIAHRAAQRSAYRPADDMPPVWTLNDDMQGIAADNRYRGWIRANRAAVVLLSIVGLVTAALCARPSAIQRDNDAATRRDIVLCLDASESALPYDQQILESYLKLTEHFSGERIGLSIFNSTSRTVFPLTDDYSLVKNQLQYASDLLANLTSSGSVANLTQDQIAEIDRWLEGTWNITDASSLIGDGLVSCAMMLPEFVLNKGRSSGTTAGSGTSASPGSSSAASSDRTGMILLATDNMTNGTGVYTLGEGLDLTDRSNIAVDGLYAGTSLTSGTSEAVEMRTLIEQHGGVFEMPSSQDAIDNLVRDIDNRSVGEEQDVNRSDLRDRPLLFLAALALLWLLYLAIEGALRR